MVVSAQDPGDDGALVLAVQQGDADAFDALFRRHYPSVRRACVRRLFDPLEADEVAQAAFVRAFERIDQCAGDRRFGPWVHVIARSMCMDAFRAQARVEPFEELLNGRGDQRTNEPEESVLRGERAAHMQEALAALPERQRTAVLARDWEELRPGEIADRLGLSIGAVDSLLLRARRRLALSYRRLAGEGGGGSTRGLRAAVAAIAALLAIGPNALLAGGAAAADAVQATASRAAEGVVGAVSSVASTLGGGNSDPAPTTVPDAPAVVTTTVVTASGPPGARAATQPVVPEVGPVPVPPIPLPPLPTSTTVPAVPGPTVVLPLPSSIPSTTTTTAPPPTSAAPSVPGPAPLTVSVPVLPGAGPQPPTATVDPGAVGLPLPPVTTPTLPNLLALGRP